VRHSFRSHETLVSFLWFWSEESIVVFRAEDGAGSVQYPGFGKTDLNKKKPG
jgi:hypothetical protein